MNIFWFYYKSILGNNIFLWISAFTLITNSCTKIEESVPWKRPGDDYALLELDDTLTVDMYDNSRLGWIMKTSYMRKMAKSGIFLIRPVNMVVFDSLGKEAAWVDADSGAADEKITFLKAWGNVYARAQDGPQVQADSLFWNKSDKQVKTQGWVKVISEVGDTLTGVGFTSDDRLENWKILSDVRTVIRKVEQRVKEADEDTVSKAE